MKGQMRDPARIEKTISLLKAYWEENPDLRLGQILENISAISHKTCFYMEDEVIINFLAKQLEEKKE